MIPFAPSWATSAVDALETVGWATADAIAEVGGLIDLRRDDADARRRDPLILLVQNLGLDLFEARADLDGTERDLARALGRLKTERRLAAGGA